MQLFILQFVNVNFEKSLQRFAECLQCTSIKGSRTQNYTVHSDSIFKVIENGTGEIKTQIMEEMKHSTIEEIEKKL